MYNSMDNGGPYRLLTLVIHFYWNEPTMEFIRTITGKDNCGQDVRDIKAIDKFLFEESKWFVAEQWEIAFQRARELYNRSPLGYETEYAGGEA